MHHNSEPEAVDLLLEVDSISGISEHVDDKNADRTCRYLVAVAAYLAFPDNGAALSAAYDSYLKVGKVHDAMRVALSMNDRGRAEKVFIASEDELDKQQLGYLLARQGVMLDCEEGRCTIEDEDLREKASAHPMLCDSNADLSHLCQAAQNHCRHGCLHSPGCFSPDPTGTMRWLSWQIRLLPQPVLAQDVAYCCNPYIPTLLLCHPAIWITATLLAML